MKLLLCIVCASLGCGSKEVDRVDRVDTVDGLDRVDAGGQTIEEPLPQAPPPPVIPTPLEVEGFAPASHVGPSGDEAWPRPVVIVLHGNFDRPEWECDVWGEAASFHGWVICPRGVRTPWASRKEDRWTYKGKSATAKEIEASLAALENRYPGRVTRERTVLAGFSLGGILIPGLATDSPQRYPYLFLVEGGVEKLDRKMIKTLGENGVMGIGLAMSAPGRRNIAKSVVPVIEKRGMKGVFVDMKGAGHGYSEDFTRRGREGLEALLAAEMSDAGSAGGSDD